MKADRQTEKRDSQKKEEKLRTKQPLAFTKNKKDSNNQTRSLKMSATVKQKHPKKLYKLRKTLNLNKVPPVDIQNMKKSR